MHLSSTRLIHSVVSSLFSFGHTELALGSPEQTRKSPEQARHQYTTTVQHSLSKMDRAMGGLCDQVPQAWPPPSPKPAKKEPSPYIIRQPNHLTSQEKKQPLPPLTFPEDDEENAPVPSPNNTNNIQHYNPHRVFRDDPYDDPPQVQLDRQREAAWEAQFDDHDYDWGAKVDGEYRDSIFSPGQEGWQSERGWQLDINAAADDEDHIADVNLGAIGKVTDLTSGGEASGTLRLVDDVAFLPEGFDIKSRSALSVSCNLALNEPGEDNEDDRDIAARLEPVPKDLKPVQPQPNPDDVVARLLSKGSHLDVQQKIQQKQEEHRLITGKENSKLQTEGDPIETDTKNVKAKRIAPAPSPFIAQRRCFHDR